jgi:polyketide cyclase/dehydrase/lipid transport protein
LARKRAERQIEIEAAPRACFDALLDYESFPEWQNAVVRAEVLTRDREGRGERVAFEIDAKLRTIRYTLDYGYEEPHLVNWRYVEGDVRDVDGELVLEDLGEDKTLATYALRIDPGVWLPGRLADMLSGQVMQGVLEDLKHRVENSAS